jgi:hypothetical protein
LAIHAIKSYRAPKAQNTQNKDKYKAMSPSNQKNKNKLLYTGRESKK